MSDNTIINPGSGGDTIRDLARQGGTVKTQSFALDLGGPAANAEILITAGQQVMAASVPVVIASDQPAILVQQNPSSNKWAQALAVTNGSTATIISIVNSATNYQIKGFVALGNGDGYFAVQIAAVTVLSGRINSALPTFVVTLPNGINVTTGSTVTLQVTNISGSTADFEATLLGN